MITNAPDPPYISKSNSTLYEGMPLQLYIFNAEGANFTWKTTDNNIATVTQDGLVIAKNVGKCKIYASVRGKLLICTINVKDGICGDVNIDNNVSLIDAVWLGKYITGSINLNQASLNNSDCFADEAINVNDLMSLLSYLTMKAEYLPQGG